LELGSEFSLGDCGRTCDDTIFQLLQNFDTVYVDSGRSALKLLLAQMPSGTALLPAYICESVYQCFPSDKVRFYELTPDLEIDWDSLFQQLDGGVSIVYLHYFNGVLPKEATLWELQKVQKNLDFQIIEDTTHSIFSSVLTVGDYGICSLRKWFPIPDGGVVYGRELERDGETERSSLGLEESAGNELEARVFIRTEGGRSQGGLSGIICRV